jgi:hypothetical protein
MESVDKPPGIGRVLKKKNERKEKKKKAKTR